jgi:hypothetical protein
VCNKYLPSKYRRSLRSRRERSAALTQRAK